MNKKLLKKSNKNSAPKNTKLFFCNRIASGINRSLFTRTRCVFWHRIASTLAPCKYVQWALRAMQSFCCLFFAFFPLHRASKIGRKVGHVTNATTSVVLLTVLTLLSVNRYSLGAPVRKKTAYRSTSTTVVQLQFRLLVGVGQQHTRFDQPSTAQSDTKCTFG